MRQRFPVYLVLAAFCALALGLWLTGQRTADQEANPRPNAAAEANTKPGAEMVPLNSPEQSMVEAFAAAQPSRIAGAGPSPGLIPEEWEKPLFDILLDENQTLDQRNARLIEMATGPAQGVPSVQEECVMHLAFGLPDAGGAQFLTVATNPAIPLEMRAGFLRQTLDMRPQELGEWLSTQLINHHEPAISGAARLYLLDLRNSEQ